MLLGCEVGMGRAGCWAFRKEERRGEGRKRWSWAAEKGRAGQKSERKGKAPLFFFSNFPKPF
jgi:hypothetical protein